MGEATALGQGCGKGRDAKRATADGSSAKRDDVYCIKKGIWVRECRKKKWEEAHLAKLGDYANPVRQPHRHMLQL
jgi:hypothetical protein